MMQMDCDPGPSTSRPRAMTGPALIENLDRLSVHELERMRERQMKIINRPRRVAAPPSDETERKRARLKVESIEHRLEVLRSEIPPPDQTHELMGQMDMMSVGKPVQVELKKEEDAQRRALHAQAINTRGISEEEKRRRILAYMSFKGDSDDDDDDEDMDEDDEDEDDLFGDYEDGDMEADEYGLGGIIQVDTSRYANFGD
ncbi:hypothetical protein FRC07_011655 [Ceratobasidium sp. 392]|nr:hypothetical protein FRC07_011655 [Ceratobasidium sp. 392]